MEIEQCGNGSSSVAKGRAKATRVLAAAGISRAAADGMSPDVIEAKLEAKGVEKETISSVVDTEKQRQADDREAVAAKVSAKVDKEDFQFRKPPSVKEANELLRRIRERQAGASLPVQKTETKSKTAAPIQKYKDFESEISKTYDRLNKDYNLGGLVSISRVREEVGDRVSRSQFNDWLLQMQENDKFRLIGGETVNPRDQQGGVTTSLGGARFFMQRL
jgi:hypothetical protein